MSAQRTSFHFPREAVAKLESIMDRSRLDSPAATIRMALSVYDELLEVTLAGCKIVIRDKAGKEWPYSPYTPFVYPGLGTANIPDGGSSTGKRAIPKNFFFSGEAVERLNSIRTRCRVQSNADVIRVALGAYSELIAVIAAEDDIVIRDPQGHDRKYTPYAPLCRTELALTDPSARHRPLASPSP